MQEAVVMFIKHNYMKTYWGSLGTFKLEGVDGQLKTTADLHP